MSTTKSDISKRYRGFLPVVIDIETAGLNSKSDAILEIAAIILTISEDNEIVPQESHFCHVIPFKGANLDQESLEFTKIDPYHPFRFAVDENEALKQIFSPIKKAIKDHNCSRAVLVGHNPNFDLSFIKAAAKRCGYKKTPFHLFTTFDTATLAGIALGQTVLAIACEKAGIKFETRNATRLCMMQQKRRNCFVILLINLYQHQNPQRKHIIVFICTAVFYRVIMVPRALHSNNQIIRKRHRVSNR